MIFNVKNLGYIEEASVDLSKDLIVLTGQNNTGKTYLAYAIYGLFVTEDNSYFYFIADNFSYDDKIEDIYYSISKELLNKGEVNFKIDFSKLFHLKSFNSILNETLISLNTRIDKLYSISKDKLFK